MAVLNPGEISAAGRFWETAAGLRALAYLDGWGAVVRVRTETGDPSAVPCAEVPAAGHRDTSPIAAVVDRYLDVERALGDWWGDRTRMRRLLVVIHGYGVEQAATVHRVRYELARSGPEEYRWTEWLSPSDPAPARYLDMETKGVILRIESYDLRSFACDATDAYARASGREKASLLRAEHRGFGRWVAETLGFHAPSAATSDLSEELSPVGDVS